MTDMVTIAPQAGPQSMFLSNPADIIIYGGAAGGGKTYGLLLEPLRHINNPTFRTVIFRRTSPQIINPGGMWDDSTRIYPLLGARSNKTFLSWTFNSGAVVRFAHLQYEHNKLDWQGAQIDLIGFDELTHFEESQFVYLLSRSRSVSGVRPYIRATTNPDADSWVVTWVAWWIDPESGYPIPERSGIIRYCYRKEGSLHWADEPEELYDRFPEIEQIAATTQRQPRDLIKSFTFISAKLDDNQILLMQNPEYLANLLALPPVEQERLLAGNWKIRDSAGKVFSRAWFEIVEGVPVTGGVECRFWDLAATERKLAGDDPNYTAGVKIRLVNDTYYVMDCLTMQASPPDVDQAMREVAHNDYHLALAAGVAYQVRWEEEGGASGIRDSHRLTRMLSGYDARGVRPSGDKITRAKPLAAQAFVGNVKLVKGLWNEEWLQHMHHQPDWPNDDIMDASSGSFNELSDPGAEYGQSPTADWRG